MTKRIAHDPQGHGDTEDARKWAPREMQMVSDYLAQFFPKVYTLTRVKLGSIPPSETGEVLEEHEVRMLSVYSRWADAIAITSDTIYLIEGAIRPDLGDISKLQAYRRLLPNSPDIKQYWPRKVEMQLVYAIEDPLITTMAREAGIRPIQFKPAYLDDYIKSLYPRHQRAPKVGT